MRDELVVVVAAELSVREVFSCKAVKLYKIVVPEFVKVRRPPEIKILPFIACRLVYDIPAVAAGEGP